MRLIDADALEKFLSDAEMEATKRKKYVFAGALNVIQGNVRNFPTIEPESKWIPFHKRPLTEEEQKEHKDWCWILDCELPDDNQEVLISSPYFGVYIDTFYNDGECSFDGGEEINDGMAWQPLPEPYHPKEDES